jgi:myosin-crossreactive antigen
LPLYKLLYLSPNIPRYLIHKGKVLIAPTGFKSMYYCRLSIRVLLHWCRLFNLGIALHQMDNFFRSSRRVYWIQVALLWFEGRHSIIESMLYTIQVILFVHVIPSLFTVAFVASSFNTGLVLFWLAQK